MKKLQIQFQSESGDKTKSIDFDLYDLPVVNRFVDLLNHTKSASFIEGRVDVRRSNTTESTLSLAAEMNTVVDTVNTLREDLLIDESLKLDLDIEPHLQVKKLNKLHEIFQLYTEVHGINANQTQIELERVNILVHLLEAGPVEMDQVFIVAKQVGPIPQGLELTPEDHMLRKPHALWGELEMDYHTVGKDLGACFWTDDSELVATGELRQQTTLCPGIAVNFMTGPHNAPTDAIDQQKEAEFYTWCEKNNLNEHIDYTDPQYRLGRLRIGRISNEYTIQEIQDLVLYYPDITDIILKSDK
tara:strand:+ start:97 stop:999 length:903 start_codon:yes stop_codon:yes gene_type:complete